MLWVLEYSPGWETLRQWIESSYFRYSDDRKDSHGIVKKTKEYISSIR